MKTQSSALGWMIAVMALAVTPGASLWAQVPNRINYSGVLTTPQGEPREGQFNMTFRLYGQPVGGAPVVPPQTVGGVQVRKGQFSVVLGPWPGGPSPDVAFSGGDRYLEVQVGNDPPLLPRQQLLSVPFAQRTASVDGARGGTILGGVTVVSSSGNGVWAVASAASGNNHGVHGEAASPSGVGVFGGATAASGFTVGVYGRSNSLEGAGGLFQNLRGGDLLQGWNHVSPVVFRVFNNGGAYFNGNVGIGLANPTAKLSIHSPSYPTTFTGRQSPSVIHIGSGMQTNQYAKIGFGTGHGAIGLKITDSGSYLSFGTSNNYAQGVTNEAMTIDYNANVGIGTVAPAYKLDVAGPIRKGCPPGWVDRGHFCVSPVQGPTTGSEADTMCARNFGAHTCSVGEYYEYDTTACSNNQCWSNGFCDALQTLYVTKGSGWWCAPWNAPRQYHCCQSKH